ncbi:MAG: hypothetical protein ACHQCF_08510, partial [Solirubrobacterales bacterium]
EALAQSLLDLVGHRTDAAGAIQHENRPSGGGVLRDPLVIVAGHALLPGVPELCRLQFRALAPRMRSRPFLLRQVFVRLGEPVIAGPLDAVAARHPTVDVGSYPRFDAGADYRVKLTLESRDAAAVGRALEDLLASLPEGSVIRQE